MLILFFLVSWGLITAVPTPTDPAVYDAAAQIALAAGCDTSACRERRGPELAQVARDVVDACAAYMPARHCLTLVATLQESRALAYPTCSATACRSKCGALPAGRDRACRIRCARKRGRRAFVRARKCNDGGVSVGWFQMKRIITRHCSRHLKVKINPHDVKSAARCYAWLAARGAARNACGVYDEGERYAVAFARIAAGPFLRTRDPHTGRKRARCWPHRYARLALARGRLPRAVID